MSKWDLRSLRLAILSAGLALPLVIPQLVAAGSDSSDDGTGFAVCCLIALAIVVVVNLALVVWLLQDANNRGASPGAWILVFLIFGPLALLGYMIVRPRGKLVPCPECGRQKPIIDQICPHCGRRVV